MKNLFSMTQKKYLKKVINVCKFLSEGLIFASTNPQYDDRLLIELQVQYMKIPSSEHWEKRCVQKLILTFRTIYVYNMFSPFSAKIRASDKDLPVLLLFLDCQGKKFCNFANEFFICRFIFHVFMGKLSLGQNRLKHTQMISCARA